MLLIFRLLRDLFFGSQRKIKFLGIFEKLVERYIIIRDRLPIKFSQVVRKSYLKFIIKLQKKLFYYKTVSILGNNINHRHRRKL